MKIKKAIIPAAGLGTRMLPATKAIPKEMLTVVDKPVIQYVVEEAVEAGITDILIIISKGKEAIYNHFNTDPNRITELRNRGKDEVAESLLAIDQIADIKFIYQEEQLGLGHAILQGEEFVDGVAFAVLLGDSIMHSSTEQGVLSEMITEFDKYSNSIVAVSKIPREEVFKYGVLDGITTSNNSVLKVKNWVEKPGIEEAPSDLVISGLYLLTPAIFEMLRKTKKGYANEIQLTDAMCHLLQTESMYAYIFNGQRFDIGSKLDFVKTNLFYSLQSKEIQAEIEDWLKELATTSLK